MFRHVTPPTPGFMMLAALSLGCANPTAPAASLSGRWVQYGIDTRAEFVLVQRGTAVTGTYGWCSPNFGGGCATPYEVRGTVWFQHVVLRWTEWNVQRYDVTFDGTVAGDTLREASNGQPLAPFVRAPGP